MRKLTKEQFIEKATNIHGDRYDYSKVNYINYDTKVEVGCRKHGFFYQFPVNHLKGAGCSKCNVDLNRLTKEQFIEKAKEIHGGKYDYSNVIYNNYSTKVKIKCPIHGEFLQSPRNHLVGQECGICGKNKISLTTEEFIQRARLTHGDKYEYNKTVYSHNKTKVVITCLDHGDFEQIPNDHLTGHGCPKCQKSKGELTISKILEKQNIKYIEQYKIPGASYRYEYDFYLPELNILIEFHGPQHYEYIPFFHKTIDYFLHRKNCDMFKRELAQLAKIPLIEFNYKQLENLSKLQFEELIMKKIKIDT